MPRTATTGTNRSRSTTPSRSTRSTRSRKDAFALLQEDHKSVQKAFRQFSRMDHEEDTEAMRALVEETCHALEVHTTLEEELFYPALREMIAEDQADLLEEAEVEHGSAKQLIAALQELQPGDPKYVATFTVLGEYVKHHIEEEESEIFKQARKAKLDVEALGEEMRARREALMGEGEESETGEGRSAKTGGKPMEVDDEEDMQPATPRRTSR